MNGKYLQAVYAANEEAFSGAVAAKGQYRYVINLNERGEFSASLYQILPDGRNGVEVWNIDSEEAEFLALEKVDLCRAESVVDYAASIGSLPSAATGIEAWEAPIMTDPMESDEWEFSLVSSETAELLRHSGHAVIEANGTAGASLHRKIYLWCRDTREGAVALTA